MAVPNPKGFVIHVERLLPGRWYWRASSVSALGETHLAHGHTCAHILAIGAAKAAVYREVKKRRCADENGKSIERIYLTAEGKEV